MIVIDSNIPLLPKVLEPTSDVRIISSAELTNAVLKETNCTALFVRSTTKVSSQLLDSTSVRFVGTATSGFDHVETEYLAANNITFANAAGSNANSVAEYVVFSILKYCIKNKRTPDELILGIIGFGNIGKLVGYYGHLLGCDIIVNDPPLRNKNFEFPEWVDEYCELDTLLYNADVITPHVPYVLHGDNPTHNLLEWTTLESVQEQSLIINTSRGGVVNEQALLFHAKENGLSFVTDVWEGEPNINRTLAQQSILATPHIAGHSYDGKLLGSLMMVNAYAKLGGAEYDTSVINDELSLQRKSIIDFASYEAIYTTINNQRKIDEDSEQFKSIINNNQADVPELFSTMRNEYPKRRELLKL